MAAENPSIIHATTVAVDRAGLLIRGPSGRGKSELALQMLAFGGQLVADDRTTIATPDDGPPVASAPDQLSGMIEARGIGILRVAPCGAVRLAAVADLSEIETERLPEARTTLVAGRVLPLYRRVDAPSFAASLMLLLRGGRVA